MKIRNWAMPMLFGVVVVFGAGPLVAQETKTDVQIINRDGENVSPRVIAIQKSDDAQADQAKADASALAGGGISIKNEDGKIIIVDADGTTREIDVNGAQSIIVNQSVKSIMKDGEKQTKSFGKAIIIGPDGKRQEIELGGPVDGTMKLVIPEFAGLDNVLPGVMRLDRTQANKFVIGVNCAPVSESLSSQLNLETGVGLVVESISDDSPASVAGLKKHDIMMYVDDTQLIKTSDLVDAVQRAGKEKSKLSLTAIRGGKEITIEVAPAERPAMEQADGQEGMFQMWPQLNGDQFDLQFKQMGPGVIVGSDQLPADFHAHVQKQMEEMQAEIQRMQQTMKDQMGIDKDN